MLMVVLKRADGLPAHEGEKRGLVEETTEGIATLPGAGRAGLIPKLLEIPLLLFSMI